MKKESDMKWSAILLVVILTFALSVNANQGIKTIKPDPVIQSETEWGDSIIKNMILLPGRHDSCYWKLQSRSGWR